jgi:hypothetical protein
LRARRDAASYELFAADLAASELDLKVEIDKTAPFKGYFFVTLPRVELPDAEAQLAWICETANRFVTHIRPYLSRIAAET